MVKKVRREVRVVYGVIQPKAKVTREQKQAQNRQAATAFWGCGGCRHFDEPPDPTEAISATTPDEWRELQVLVRAEIFGLPPGETHPCLSPEDNLLQKEYLKEQGSQ